MIVTMLTSSPQNACLTQHLVVDFVQGAMPVWKITSQTSRIIETL